MTLRPAATLLNEMEAVRFNWDYFWEAAIVAAWFLQARWVWLDAERKYGRGKFWGFVAAFFPLGGLVFYLLYRDSALMEIDMADAELEYEFELASTVQVSRAVRNRPPRRDGWLTRRAGLRVVSKSDKLNAKELRQRAVDVEYEQPMLAKELREKADALDPPRLPRKPFRQVWRAYWAIRRDKFHIWRKRKREKRDYLRRPKKLRRHDEFVEKLKSTPLVDPTMEGLIFEGQYEVARERAIINLQIAEESGDERRRITYRRYLNQIDKITHVYFPESTSEDADIPQYELAGGGSEE